MALMMILNAQVHLSAQVQSLFPLPFPENRALKTQSHIS